MNFHFYSPLYYEQWDHRSPDDPGIGGSETAVVEMAWRLARRGHEVKVFAPIRDDCPPVDKGGARWFDCSAADFSASGIWVLSRCPSIVDAFADPHPGQKILLVCQDVIYPPDSPGGLTHERAAKLDLLIALCSTQGIGFKEVYPEISEKIALSTNGFKVDLAERIEAEDDEAEEREPGSGLPGRDPFKLIYTSSPDRGLRELLKIVKRAQEFEPRIHLTASYGWDNIEKVGPDVQLARMRAEIEALMAETGSVWLGRLGQEALYREFLSAGLWVYPTAFTETSCITCMEAQALGAIPITAPLWALADNVRHGIFIQGTPKDPFVRARYVGELVKLARDHKAQEKVRPGMMEYARQRFNWEQVVEQYEGFGHPRWGGRFDFQIRHGNGRVLNVGSNDDHAGFGNRGGVNLDLHPRDVYLDRPNKVDVLADCRDPLPFPPASFDSVVFGDILEHMSDEDAVRSLKNGKAVLKDGGKIVITVPEDYRPVERQRERPGVAYAENIDGSHLRPITLDVVRHWLANAGLREELHEPLTYVECSCQGHGVIAC